MEARTGKVLREAEAGQKAKGDTIVKIQPRDLGSGIKLEIQSKVMSLFGDQIRQSVLEEVDRYALRDALVIIDDVGALDYAIRARVQAAIERACREEQ